MDVEAAVELIKSVAVDVFPGSKAVAAVEESCGRVAIDTGDVQVFVSVIPGSLRGVSVAKFVTAPFLGCSEAFMAPEGLIAIIVSERDREKIIRKLKAVSKAPRTRA